MKLSEIIFYVGTQFSGEDIDIENICDDSRNVTKGSLFVCIKGDNFDGHDFINDAVKRGAVAIIVEHDVSCESNVTLIKVRNSRFALSMVLKAWYHDPGKNIKVIAVTGTNGKTSTVSIMSEIFRAAGYKVGVIGTLSCETDSGKIDISESGTHSFTTPDQIRLYRAISQMADEGIEYLFMEASSHALSQYRLDGIDIYLGIFTNLSVDHLDFHENMERYFFAKSRLFDISKMSLFNIDDKYGRVLYDTFCDCYSYGKHENADFKASDIDDCGVDGVKYHMAGKFRDVDIYSRIPGRFTVYNTLAAASGAMLCGIDQGIIARAISDFSGVPGRMQKLWLSGAAEFDVFIDYAHTPDALESLILSVREFRKSGQRIITLFGCGGDRDRSKRKEMGRIATKLSDFTVITSDNSRSEPVNNIIRDIMRGIDHEKAYTIIENRKDAILYALNMAKKGDIILLCGKGHEKYEIDGSGKHYFNEAEIVYSAVFGNDFSGNV